MNKHWRIKIINIQFTNYSKSKVQENLILGSKVNFMIFIWQYGTVATFDGVWWITH